MKYYTKKIIRKTINSGVVFTAYMDNYNNMLNKKVNKKEVKTSDDVIEENYDHYCDDDSDYNNHLNSIIDLKPKDIPNNNMFVEQVAYLSDYLDCELINNYTEINIKGLTERGRRYGTDKSVVLKIPKTISGKPVVSIDNSAFRACNLTKLTLPDTITTIKESAFADNKLTSLNLPDSLISISDNAFSYNNIKDLYLSKNTKFVGDKAFYKNKIDVLIIPEGVSVIGKNAFSENDIDAVFFPNSLTTIENYAFSKNNLIDIKIPDNVSKIGVGVFSENRLENVEFSKSLKEIDFYAFFQNKLEKIDLPDNIESIGNGAFSENNIKILNIPNNVKNIGESAFSYNQLIKVELPNFLENVGRSAFFNNYLTIIKIPNSIKSVGFAAFGNNYLKHIDFSSCENAVALGQYAFANHNVSDLDEAILSNKITELYDGFDYVENAFNIPKYCIISNSDVKYTLLESNGKGVANYMWSADRFHRQLANIDENGVIVGNAFKRYDVKLVELPYGVTFQDGKTTSIVCRPFLNENEVDYYLSKFIPQKEGFEFVGWDKSELNKKQCFKKLKLDGENFNQYLVDDAHGIRAIFKKI